MALTSEATDLLCDARLSAHLATSVDDRPHVAPVWYVLDDRDGETHLYLLTGGTKLRNLRANPRVAVSVERATHESGVDWAVTVQGTARLVRDDARVERVRTLIDEKYTYGETDGGESATGGDEGGAGERTDEERADTDDADGTQENWGLVEIRVGTVVVQRY